MDFIPPKKSKQWIETTDDTYRSLPNPADAGVDADAGVSMCTKTAFLRICDAVT